MTNEQITQLRDGTNLVALVGDTVKLKSSGMRHVGLCPFHNERTPSFTVHQASNKWHCFGCGKGGSAFDFLMEQGMTFIDAAHFLNEYSKMGLDLEAKPGGKDDTAWLYDGLKGIHEETVAATEAMRLQVGLWTGYSDEMLKEFGVGMFPYVYKGRFTLAQLTEMGLCSKNHVPFSQRIVWPIRDRTGRVIGLGGRKTELCHVDSPKWVNSYDSKLYRKSSALYGIHVAVRNPSKDRAVFVVEGYKDCDWMQWSGNKNTVATCGTAFTDGHLLNIMTFAKTVVFLFDGDEAGKKAARTALEMCAAKGFPARAVLLPEGMDPEDYIRSPQQPILPIQDYCSANSQDWATFVGKTSPTENIEEKYQKLTEMLKSVSRFSDPILRGVHISSLAKEFGVKEAELYAKVSELIKLDFKNNFK